MLCLFVFFPLSGGLIHFSKLVVSVPWKWMTCTMCFQKTLQNTYHKDCNCKFIIEMACTSILIMWPHKLCAAMCNSPWAKLIVPPALAPGTQADQTSPWLVIAGDPGCPGIARHFQAGAEQSCGLFAPSLMIFLVRPVTWTGHPRFPQLKDNQVGPMSNGSKLMLN